MLNCEGTTSKRTLSCSKLEYATPEWLPFIHYLGQPWVKKLASDLVSSVGQRHLLGNSIDHSVILCGEYELKSVAAIRGSISNRRIAIFSSRSCAKQVSPRTRSLSLGNETSVYFFHTLDKRTCSTHSEPSRCATFNVSSCELGVSEIQAFRLAETLERLWAPEFG